MRKDGEGANIFMQFDHSTKVCFYECRRGTATRSFRAQGCEAALTLTECYMGEKGEIDLVECQGGAYTCRQEVMVTRV
jgi:hypothetical protein